MLVRDRDVPFPQDMEQSSAGRPPPSRSPVLERPEMIRRKEITPQEFAEYLTDDISTKRKKILRDCLL